MSKWMCEMCSKIADQPLSPGTGNSTLSHSFNGIETPCGAWLDVTHVFRAGQEKFKDKALAARPPRHGGPGTAATSYDGGIDFYESNIRRLPLDGDDD